jgi:small ligand-binding sensory domain FIST
LEFHAAISDLDSTQQALNSVLTQLHSASGRVDVAWVFFTADHARQKRLIVERLRKEMGEAIIVGCAGEGVIGGTREIERRPGIAVLAGGMPDAQVHPFHIPRDDWRELLHDPDAFTQRLGINEQTRGIIGFGDPWTTPLNQFLEMLDACVPQAPLVGGLASAARAPGQNVLLCNDEIYNDGFTGVTLGGALEVQTVVSQGARPIGSPMVITKGHDNVIEQLGGRAPMTMLREIFMQLPERDRDLLRHGLLIGRVISEYQETFSRGDFLVRNITGADEESGSMSLTDYVKVGQTVQFHVRDEASADEDLRLLLASATMQSMPAAALLFSCNGRGSRMFGLPNHDIAVANHLMPDVPVAGFFAAGEIGPVGRKNFIHGHTASFALLRGC